MNIVDLVNFKENINEMIDNYMNIIKSKGEDKNIGRILDQTMTYYERIKTLCTFNQNSDDDDDDDDFCSDDIIVDDNDVVRLLRHNCRHKFGCAFVAQE